MPRNYFNSKAGEPKTLAETVYYLTSPERRVELEQFRIEFERLHGPTNFSQDYTSTLPPEEQDRLFRDDPAAYYAGLPLFVQDYLFQKMRNAARVGRLDDMPTPYVGLYVTGGMLPTL